MRDDMSRWGYHWVCEYEYKYEYDNKDYKSQEIEKKR